MESGSHSRSGYGFAQGPTCFTTGTAPPGMLLLDVPSPLRLPEGRMLLAQMPQPTLQGVAPISSLHDCTL